MKSKTFKCVKVLMLVLLFLVARNSAYALGVQVSYVEPIGNVDGTTLSDLSFCTIYIDNFKVVEIPATSPYGGGSGKSQIDIPSGQHTVYATATDTSGNESGKSEIIQVSIPALISYPMYPTDVGVFFSLLQNDSFENGISSWYAYSGGTFGFNAESPGFNSNRSGCVTLVNLSSNMQLMQYGFSLEANTKYLLSFDAKSISGHDVAVSVIKHTSPYNNYGLSGIVADLSAIWKHFDMEFTTTGFSGTTLDVRLMFWFVPYATTGDSYFFDNVILSKKQ
ncbi:MAG: hypothetical protein EPN85_09745 [Bacteroidetes bacterium]|nr:MAG: hypothetical protein EPN85_09745 [Bacteroidota bacterium]